jgi:hypothetical protein
MDKIQEILQGFLTPSGQLWAAVLLFMAVWILKTIPWFQQNVLTSDRLKLLTALILASVPAGALVAGSSTSSEDIGYTMLLAILGAMGIQGGAKAALGPALRSQIDIGSKESNQQERRSS